MTDKRPPQGPSIFVWYWFLVLGVGLLSAANARAAPGDFECGIQGQTIIVDGVGSCSTLALDNYNTEQCINQSQPYPQVDNVTYSWLSASQRHRWKIDVSCGPFDSSYYVFLEQYNECAAPETLNTTTGECEGGQTCDGNDTGKRETLPFMAGTNIPSQGLCDTASGCNFVPVDKPFCHSDTVSGAETCSITLEKTADNCTLPTDSDMDANSDNAKCASVGGTQICLDPQDPNDGFNCGYVNDEYICLGAIPDGQCIFLSDGGMACDSSAGSPPAPDDGVTPGTPASPDGQLSDGTDTTNLYNGGTVGGSVGTPTGDSGNNGPNGELGDPDDDEGGGTGTASGDCNTPPSCSGDAIQCAILEQEWHSACQDIGDEASILSNLGITETLGDLEAAPVDLDTALDDSGWIGTAACVPDITVDTVMAGVVTIPVSNWCPLFAFLGVLTMVSASLVSLRIIGGAF